MFKKNLWNIVHTVILSAAVLISSSAAVCAEESVGEDNIQVSESEVQITLADDGILVDENEISTDVSAAVYKGAELIYY